MSSTSSAATPPPSAAFFIVGMASALLFFLAAFEFSNDTKANVYVAMAGAGAAVAALALDAYRDEFKTSDFYFDAVAKGLAVGGTMIALYSALGTTGSVFLASVVVFVVAGVLVVLAHLVR